VSDAPETVAILAGGLGTRLGPLATDRPKALVEVAGAPFVVHQLRLLRAHGLTRVVLCVGHLGAQIAAAVGDGHAWGVDVAYAWDGPALRGTAGALRGALPLLGRAFYVLYGDSFLDCDYRAIGTAWARSGRAALMTVLRNDGRWDRSNVEYGAGAIRAYDKRRPTPAMRHVDYGLGVLTAEALADVPETGAADLADLYTALVAQGRLAAYLVRRRFYEVGSPAGLAATRRYLEARTRTQEVPS